MDEGVGYRIYNGSSLGAALFCSKDVLATAVIEHLLFFSCILSKPITSVGDSRASEPPECHGFLLFSHPGPYEPPPWHFSFLIVSELPDLPDLPELPELPELPVLPALPERLKC